MSSCSEPSASPRQQRRRILGWCSAIGLAVLISTLIGWVLLRDLDLTVLSLLFASAAGGMFYLTVAKLVPYAEQRQYQQSAAISTAAGFVIVLALSKL